MSGKDLVLDLVNAKNQLPKPLDLSLANVMGIITDPDNKSWISTTIVPMPSTYYEEPVEVEYNRVSLTEMFRARNEEHQWETHYPHIEGPHASDLHTMIDWIAKEIGLPLSKYDVENKDFSWLKQHEEVNIPLIALDTSLLYHGQAIVRYTRRRMSLDEVIRKTEVNAIRKPNITEDGFERNKASVTAATWPVDFTEHYNAVRKHALYDRPGNGSALVALMRDMFGFSNWPAGSNQRMVDYPADAIADANHNYDRVIIQYFNDTSSNKSRPYEGPAYFHYNIMNLDDE